MPPPTPHPQPCNRHHTQIHTHTLSPRPDLHLTPLAVLQFSSVSNEYCNDFWRPKPWDLCFNSLWPGDTIWRQRSGSPLAQVMACCLTAPSHYLNQCWLTISKVEWHSSKGKFTRDTLAIITEIIWKIKYLKWHSNFPGTNELICPSALKFDMLWERSLLLWKYRSNFSDPSGEWRQRTSSRGENFKFPCLTRAAIRWTPDIFFSGGHCLETAINTHVSTYFR